MSATIRAIEYHLPAQVLSSEDLATLFPEWSVAKIEAKTGIRRRHIASEGETAGDLAFAAASKLFDSGMCSPSDIDFILLCTQSPDYFLPTTACLLQHRLGIPTTAGALDFNLGCSGFVYGLGLAQGLIDSGQASRVLLLTAETYSKYIHPQDRSVRTLFGDAAAATLIEAATGPSQGLGPFVYGTDGAGGENLIVCTGGFREARSAASAEPKEDPSGNVRTRDHLFMNGGEIFTFTLSAVPDAVNALLAKAGLGLGDIDLFVFHQANRYMLEHLRKAMGIDARKFFIHLVDCGNTVSSTIPIALKEAHSGGQLQPGMRVMLVGFGVGYSWGATLLHF
jgi:3-oxoacyl-[acyl-carrier-protein] synthase III